MASNLRLREPLRLGVRKIHGLRDEAVSELRSALAAAGLKLDPEDLAEEMAPLVHSISREEVDAIVETLSGLAIIVASSDVPLELFVEDVCEAIGEGEHALSLDDAEKEQLKSRLSNLLDNAAILVAAKARLVLIEHEHYLCYARIMTDVRPVFGLDVKRRPTAAMIVHSLKLAYHDGKDIKEFFVALDPPSLDRLSELIDRAKEKEGTMKSVLGTADIQYLDTE